MSPTREGTTPPRRPAGARIVTAILTAPAVLAIKRPLRDIWWTVKGLALRNPPVPRKVASILFVCLGNICRSPFAAVLAASRLREHGLEGIGCASAGISTRQAARPPQAACEVAVQYGVALTDHRPQLLTRELVDANDLIVVMEAGQLDSVRRAYPDAVDRVVLLSLFDRQVKGGYARYHIADPFSQPRAAFEECYGRIDRALAALLSSIRGSSPERS